MALAPRPLCPCGPGPSPPVRLGQHFPLKLLQGQTNPDPLGNIFDPPTPAKPSPDHHPEVALLNVGPGTGLTVMWPQANTQLGKGLTSTNPMISVEGH